MTTRDCFVELLAKHGTLGDVIADLDRRLIALEPIAPFVPVIQEEYANRIAPEGSLMDVLRMSDEERKEAFTRHYDNGPVEPTETSNG